jgi:hypothetical protein
VPDGPPASQISSFMPAFCPYRPRPFVAIASLFERRRTTITTGIEPTRYGCLSTRKSAESLVCSCSHVLSGPPETTTFTISHPDSDIRRIIIPAGRLTLADLPVGLAMAPFALRYFPTETKKHPWMYDCCTHDLPRLALSNVDDCVRPTDEQWRGRDTVWIWASCPGTLRLAELLLNAGCSWNPVRDYALEGDAG